MSRCDFGCNPDHPSPHCTADAEYSTQIFCSCTGTRLGDVCGGHMASMRAGRETCNKGHAVQVDWARTLLVAS